MKQHIWYLNPSIRSKRTYLAAAAAGILGLATFASPVSAAGFGSDTVPDGPENELRFDIGEITSWSTADDGQLVLQFDRWQDSDRGLYGAGWDHEPFFAGGKPSDNGLRNNNPKLREYVVAADADALQLTDGWLGAACTTGDTDDYEAYTPVDPVDFFDAEPLVTVVFDSDQTVVAIRDQRQCETSSRATPDGSGCIPGSDTLPDGTWYGYSDSKRADSFDFDLICRFSDAEASRAQVEDGLDSVVVDDTYERNNSAKLRTVPVDSDVPVTWFPDGRPIGATVTYDVWSSQNKYGLPLVITVEDGKVVRIAELWSA